MAHANSSAPATPDQPEPDALAVWLTRVSILTGVAFTATAEYQLARSLGATEPIAAMLPATIDAYVVGALRRFRGPDIALSLALMSAAQIAAHLLDAGVMRVNVPMVVVVSLLVPVAIWRTHALARPRPPAAPVPAVPAAVAVPAPEAILERVPAPEVHPELPAPVAAAEQPRRPQVRAPYTPAPGVDDLLAQVRADFGSKVPSVRALRATYSIGQPKAQQIQAELKAGTR